LRKGPVKERKREKKETSRPIGAAGRREEKGKGGKKGRRGSGKQDSELKFGPTQAGKGKKRRLDRTCLFNSFPTKSGENEEREREKEKEKGGSLAA